MHWARNRENCRRWRELTKGEDPLTTYRAAIIGVGRKTRPDGQAGFGITYHHAAGYAALDNCELVACADIKHENAEAFAEKYPGTKTYLDYKEMVAVEKPDIVSIGTWPHLHAPMTIDCANAGVKAVHCEKPMATTWEDAKQMAAVCKERGVQLTLNHQRRFGEPFRKAKELLDAGTIGKLVRLEASCPNLYDWGTHWFDMMFMYNDERPVKWVMGQFDAREGRTVFGVDLEGQGLSHFQWNNGVRGLMLTGRDSALGCSNRLIGTEGVIEVGVDQGPALRVRGKDDGRWRTVETTQGLHGGNHFVNAIADVVSCLDSGQEPVLAAWKALQATEVIFATYESGIRGGRIDLPLDVQVDPFTTMKERA